MSTDSLIMTHIINGKVSTDTQVQIQITKMDGFEKEAF